MSGAMATIQSHDVLRLARRLEQTLYTNATSIQAYSNVLTLKARTHDALHALLAKRQEMQQLHHARATSTDPIHAFLDELEREADAMLTGDMDDGMPVLEAPALTIPGTMVQPPPCGVDDRSSTSTKLCQQTTQAQDNETTTHPWPSITTTNMAPIGPPKNFGLVGACTSDVTPAVKLKLFRTRLIQLNHGNACQALECCIPYCAMLKAHLIHVASCSDAACTAMGCKSTQRLLSHYSHCRDMQCVVCNGIRPPVACTSPIDVGHALDDVGCATPQRAP
ncbi:Aste57867_19795 [Aphanomyces stellatus]|uniref:histone acetyltransferase n=1 Tax=Aphanomyces stellatus TaxID=120398 RepID=A0A485LDY8_9STRA|nr:hypothetical protein As57867_019730 [Aphanomyces stellatus]VFT96493.1 Aste57867_19795 [Aphanomyces stellatus]